MPQRDDNSLKQFDWLLYKRVNAPGTEEAFYEPPYGDVTELNTCRVIMDAVGKATLRKIAEDAIDLLETSVAIYEANGDYAFGMFSSGWCRFMDTAARDLCGTDDNREALECGHWLCHENCWNDSAKAAIESGQSTDIGCIGGIHLYAEPIYAGNRVVGAINIGYGDPPRDPEKLRELAARFQVAPEDLEKKANAYESRPKFIVDLAKKRLEAYARLIGEIVEKTEVEKSLEKNNVIFEAAGQMTKVGGWELDAETMAVNWTEQTCRIHEVPLDYKPASLEEAVSFFHPDDRATLTQAIQRALVQGEPYDMELRFITAKGNHLWTRTICRPQTRNGQITKLFGAFQDITESKRTEETLRNREKKFREIFDNSSDAIFIHDMEGRFLEVNAVACRRLGYTRDELLQMTPMDIDTHAFVHHAPKRIHEVSEKEQHVFRTAHRCRDGTEIPVEINSRRIEYEGIPGVLSVARDITERLERETEYAQLLNTSIDGFWVVDAEGRILEANPAAADTLGYSQEELREMRISDIDANENAAETAQRIAALKQKGYQRFEAQHQCKDGSLIDVEVSASHIPFGPDRFFAYIRDISHRKRHESEREVIIKVLGLLNSNNSLHELLSQVASLMQGWSGCDAVGIRLRDKQDYPYFETRGFSEGFVLAENSLCEQAADGKILRDDQGNPVLECMCGNVLRGRFDPDLPFFTENGSFWTNSTTALLAGYSDADRQARTRNRCNGEGYESVALIPLRHGSETIGLLQFNDSRPGHFDASMIDFFERLATNLAIGLVQRQTTQALRVSEEKHRLLFENTSLMISVVDYNGTVRMANTKAASMFGIAPEELIGKTLEQLYPESGGTYRKRIQQVIESGAPQYYEDRIDFPSGKRWLFTEAIPISSGKEYLDAVQVISQDITERKDAEEALRASEERFRLAFHTSPDSINLNRLEDGMYLDINDGFTNIMGYTREEIIGKTSVAMNIWRNPEDRKHLVEELKKKGYMKNLEADFIGKGGRIRRGLMSAAVLQIDNENVIISITRDITQLKQAEEEKDRLRAQLQQAQKMESIGRLAGGVAHDLNNLLSPILGYGEMLLEDSQGNDPRRESMQEILKAGSRAKDLVGQLLAFSRRQTLQFQPIDINMLIQDFEKLLRRTIREDIDIQMKLAASVPEINGDMGQLEQVVMNLAVNAQDAMPKGGTLTIETAHVELDEGYAKQKRGVTPGAYVKLAVSDTGCGMDADTLEHVFEPFYTTKGKGEGTGLGMSTAYGIVKQHGGNIWAYSEPGLGSTIKVYLPVPAETVDTVIRYTEEEPTVTGGSETVMLVEDDQQVRALASAVLKRQGYSVLVAQNGQEALLLLGEHGEKIQLLLTDVVMPDMNGKELFEQFSKIHSGIKVLYMSGYTDNVISHHGIVDQGVNFIEKPFNVKTLAAKVREALDE